MYSIEKAGLYIYRLQRETYADQQISVRRAKRRVTTSLRHGTYVLSGAHVKGQEWQLKQPCGASWQ
jgi:hypothetical protein